MAEGLSPEEANQKYLERHAPFMEELMTALVVDRPEDPAEYMLEWLRKRYSYTTLTDHEAEELRNLKKEHGKLTSKEVHAEERVVTSEDEDEEHDMEEPAQQKGQRMAVSSEAYGEWNKKGDFVARVIEKNEEQKARIIDRLSKAFMFAALDDKERNIVVDAMEERKFATGDVVIKQGDDGNDLLVVDTGSLECQRLFPGDSEPRKLKVYQPGESFGELALLYNAPRAATITALEDSILWSLDRDCFNHIVKDSAMRKRERFEQFLAQVSLLSEMDAYERSQIADVLVSQTYAQGDTVITEGDQGDVFYILEEGEAVAMKVLHEGAEPEEVMQYAPGDYFGELALLKDEPRAASVVAKTDIKVASIERVAFKRMLGPLDNILRRNAEAYNKYVKE